MLFHRVFAMMNEEIIGAVLFISVFSACVMYYFFSLFIAFAFLYGKGQQRPDAYVRIGQLPGQSIFITGFLTDPVVVSLR